jgi:hypothetical protein
MENKFKNKVRYKSFKVSVNVPFYHFYSSTKVYEIRSGTDLLWPVFLYSATTLVLGFFGSNLSDSFKAMQINLSGGEDHTSALISREYDETTNFIWNNLPGETSGKLDREGIAILLQHQEKYMDTGNELFSDTNLYYLKNELERKGYRNIKNKEVEDFFDALRVLSGKL